MGEKLKANELISINTTAGKDGKILLGGVVRELKDVTTACFDTTNLLHFIDFLKNRKTAPAIFYTDKKVQAFEGLEPAYDKEMIAECELVKTKVLEFIEALNNQQLTMNSFEIKLRTLRNYLSGDAALKLIDFCENAQVTKVKSIRRQRDNLGNYSFCFQSEAGANDFRFPKTVNVKIPVLKNIPVDIEFSFDFSFSWDESKETPTLFFTFSNLQLGEIVETAILDLVLKTLTAAKHSPLAGSYSIEKKTDEWKYKAEPLILNQY